MFTRLIEDLIARGLTEQEIGRRVGASQPTINRIKRTDRVHQYEVGSALLSLHEDLVGTKKTETVAP